MLIVFFVASFLPVGVLAAEAQGTDGTVVLTIGQKNYSKGNQLVETDIAPYIKDGRTMVPVAFVAPALGTEKALWHPEEEKVTIKKDDTLITIFIGKDEILVNDKKMKMDTVAEIADLGDGGGRTMLPIAFIARALETGYEWQEATRSVHFYGKTWIYDKAGTYGPAITPELYEGNVIVKADGVTLQNMQIKGNLTIAKEVKDGTVKLNNVTVAGETYVRGGGQDSIHINGGEYGKILVEKQDGKIRIVATNAEGIQVVISEDAKGEEVILNGNFEKVTVEVEGIKISTQGETVIDKIEVAKEAKDVEIELSKDTLVKEASLAANADIRGEGKVEKADVTANGVNLGVTVDNVQVGQGTSQPSTEGAGSSTTTSTTTSSGGGGGGGGGSSSDDDSSTPAVSAITITAKIGDDVIAGNVANDAIVVVRMTTATEGAQIRYTTDGTDPTATSNLYTVAINVMASNEAGNTVNYKAKAFKTGYTASAVAEKTIRFKATEAAAIADINAGGATVQNYTDAGITGVDAGNLADVNTAVATAKAGKGSELLKGEIQTVVGKVAAKAIIDGKSVDVDFGKGGDKTIVLGKIKALDDTSNALITALTEAEIEIAAGKATVAFGIEVTAKVTINEGADPAIEAANTAITNAIINVNNVELAYGTEVNAANIIAKLPVVAGIEYAAVQKSGDTWTITVSDTEGKGTPQTKEIEVTVAAPVIPASATVANVTVSGTKDEALAATVDVVITIVNDKIKGQISADTDLSGWITNLPAGLEAKAKAQVGANATEVTIAISGTPTATLEAAMAITIPAASLDGNADLTVTANADAKFAITE